MANTAFGINHPLAVKLYSEKLFREALKETYIGRFIGNSSTSLIQLKTDTQKGAGDKITYGLRMQLANPGVSGDNTLEGNEEALSFYSDSLTIDQIRNAVKSQGKMSEQRVPYSMREEARMALTDWLSNSLDTSFFNQITGNTGETDTRKTGMQSVTAPTAAASAGDGISRIIVGGSQDAEGSLSATTSHAITLRDLDVAVARAKTMSPVMKPLRMKGEDYFVAFIHPYQAYQLRGQTNTGQWADIQKAAMQGGNITGNPIFTGALGVYNGVILHESTRIPNTTGMADNSVYRRGVLCGQQAAAVAFGQDNGPNRTTWNEKMFDFGNQLGVAAGVIYGLKKTIFNSTDFSTIALAGYAPQP
jgi:N4-gp56 family major capsid protein